MKPAPPSRVVASKDLLIESFRHAIHTADPLTLLGTHPSLPAAQHTVVIGAGKAAAAMALALERAHPERRLAGLVTTRYGHGLATQGIRVVEAGHPVPDAQGAQAAQEMLAMARELQPDDLLVVLISGGASALMSVPAPGLSLDDLAALNRALLRCGAPIDAINVVRKHVSAIAGGRLAVATRARVLCLIISDVTGDDPASIGSGPCAADASTFADAKAILARYRVAVPQAVAAHLQAGLADPRLETPKPGDGRFARVENRIIATPHGSLEASAQWFEQRGIRAALLGDTVTGEAREVAKVYAALVREIRRYDTPFAPPVALISGGECTVTLDARHGAGRGGRCSEFLLALAIELNGMIDVWALAGDTDGIDGSQDNAGAVLDAQSLSRAAQLGLSAQAHLDTHDAWGFFHALGDLVVTGPTRTNVNDYRVLLVN